MQWACTGADSLPLFLRCRDLRRRQHPARRASRHAPPLERCRHDCGSDAAKTPLSLSPEPTSPGHQSIRGVALYSGALGKGKSRGDCTQLNEKKGWWVSGEFKGVCCCCEIVCVRGVCAGHKPAAHAHKMAHPLRQRAINFFFSFSAAERGQTVTAAVVRIKQQTSGSTRHATLSRAPPMARRLGGARVP